MDFVSSQKHTIDPLYAKHPHAPQEGLKDDGKLNILSLPVDEGGCGWYRVRQLIETLEDEGLANTYILDGDESEKELALAIEAADIILARSGTGPFVRQIKTMDPDKVIVFDHDDYTFETLPTNESYRNFGTSQVQMNGVDIWVNNRDGFNQYRNLWSMKEMEFLLMASDLNTSPTEYLSNKWAEYNGKAAVIPNAIDFSLYPELEIKDPAKGSEIRIGWQGGVSHAGDFDGIGEAIKRVMDRYKEVVFYSVGSSYDWFFKGYMNRLRKFGWLPFKAHPYRMASLDLDIAVIPLADEKFNDYKSEIKFSEFSALRVPCLVSDRRPYNEVCKDGNNCLAYKTTKEFEEKLCELIEDGKARSRLAHNANKWVKKERDLRKIAPEALKVYEQLL